MKPSRTVISALAMLLALTGCDAHAPMPAQTTPEPAADAGTPKPAPTAEASAPTPADTPRTDSARDFTLPGNFAPDTTLDQLHTRYGAANVAIVNDLPMAEGETTRGVRLFPHDPARRATLYFEDAKTLRGLTGIRINDAASKWRFEHGVRVGMTLAELVAKNGKPLSYYGLDWDYGGHVAGFNGGALEPKAGSASRTMIRLAPAASAGSGDYPAGDSEYSSDDKRWPRAGQSLVIGELMVMLPGTDDL